jgi:hypothetical protein
MRTHAVAWRAEGRHEMQNFFGLRVYHSGHRARSKIENQNLQKSKIDKMKKPKFANREIKGFCKAFRNRFENSPSRTTEMMA